MCNAGCCQCDLARHEGLASSLTFMIEQDTGATEHVVRLTILLDDPIAIQLGHRIGRIGMERRILVLGHLLHLAIQLGSRGLIDLAMFL